MGDLRSAYWDPPSLFESRVMGRVGINGSRGNDSVAPSSEVMRRLFDWASISNVQGYLELLCGERLLQGRPCDDTEGFVEAHNLRQDVSLHLKEPWLSLPAMVLADDGPLLRSNHICDRGLISSTLCQTLARQVTASRHCSLQQALHTQDSGPSPPLSEWLSSLCQVASDPKDLPLSLELRTPAHRTRIYDATVVPVSMRASLSPNLTQEMADAYADRCEFVLVVDEGGTVRLPAREAMVDTDSYKTVELPRKLGPGRPVVHRCDRDTSQLCLMDAKALPGNRTLTVRTECRTSDDSDRSEVVVLMELVIDIFITAPPAHFMGSTRSGVATMPATLPLIFRDMASGREETVELSDASAGWLLQDEQRRVDWLCKESGVSRATGEAACRDLFLSVMHEQIVERYHTHMTGMLSHLASEGYPGFPMEGHTGHCEVKQAALRRAVSEAARLKQGDDAVLVCEVGFNAGHSALGALLAGNTTVISFDLGAHGYTAHSARYLQDAFPGRLELIIGDSHRTLPTFAKLHPEVASRGGCDVVLVDGGHHYVDALADLVNMAPLSAPHAILLVDDVDMDDVKRATLELMEQGLIDASKKQVHNEVCYSQTYYRRFQGSRDVDLPGWSEFNTPFYSSLLVTGYARHHPAA